MSYRKVLAVFVLAAALFMAGCSSDEGAKKGKTGMLNEQAAEHAAAVSVYKQRCMSCHGNELQGRAGPALITIGDVLDIEQIYNVIADGSTKKGMPAFQKILAEHDIQKLADWLSEMK